MGNMGSFYRFLGYCCVGGLLTLAGVFPFHVGTAQAITLVGEAFSGSFRLPVYHATPSDRQRWLQRNSLYLLKDVINYSELSRRLEPRLSTACVQGRFSQRVVKKYFVLAKRHNTGREIVVLGFAKSKGNQRQSINLHDPDNLAQESTNYLFQYDRSGRCQVFLLGDR